MHASNVLAGAAPRVAFCLKFRKSSNRSFDKCSITKKQTAAPPQLHAAWNRANRRPAWQIYASSASKLSAISPIFFFFFFFFFYTRHSEGR